MLKTCECCGTSFSIKEGEEWKTTCLSCWKKKKRGVDPAQVRIRELEWEVARLRQEIRVSKPMNGMDSEMVKRLLQLCHPDKHGNSIASQKATQWLIGRK